MLNAYAETNWRPRAKWKNCSIDNTGLLRHREATNSKKSKVNKYLIMSTNRIEANRSSNGLFSISDLMSCMHKLWNFIMMRI